MNPKLYILPSLIFALRCMEFYRVITAIKYIVLLELSTRQTTSITVVGKSIVIIQQLIRPLSVSGQDISFLL